MSRRVLSNRAQGNTLLNRLRADPSGRTTYLGDRQWMLIIQPVDEQAPFSTPVGASQFVGTAGSRVRASAIPYNEEWPRFIERSNQVIHPTEWYASEELGSSSTGARQATSAAAAPVVPPRRRELVTEIGTPDAGWRMWTLVAPRTFLPFYLTTDEEAVEFRNYVREELWRPYRWIMNLNPNVRARIHIELDWYQNDTVSSGNITTTLSRLPGVELVPAIQMLIDQYQKRGDVEISGIYIDYLVEAPFFAQGGSRAFYEFSRHYYMVSPKTRKNCVYMAACMCKRVDEDRNPETMVSVAGLQSEAHTLKERVARACQAKGIPFRTEGTDRATMEILAQVMQAQIIVRDNLFSEWFAVGSETYDRTYEIQVRNGHAIALAPRKWFDEDSRQALDSYFLKWKNAECELYDYVVAKEMGEVGPRKIIDRSQQRMQRPAAFRRMQKQLRGEEPLTEERIGVFDVETYSDDFQPYMLGFCWNSRDLEKFPIHDHRLTHLTAVDKQVSYVVFEGLDCFEQWFRFLEDHISMIGDLTVYAHNFGKFDGLMMLDKLFFGLSDVQHRFKVTNAVEQNGSWIFVETTHANGAKLKFRDSLRLLPGPLASLTREFDVEHKKLVETVDHNEVSAENWHTPAIAEPMRLYLFHDVVGLYEVLRIFQRECMNDYMLDTAQCMTAASLSKKVFQAHYQNPSRPLYDLSWELDRKLRSSYAGGRNECFHQGLVEEPLYYYDITSLYPDVMAHNDFPWGRCKQIDTQDLGDHFGFVECEVRTIDPNRRPLHAVRANDRLCFPVLDEWTSMVLFSEEVRLGLTEKIYEYRIHKVYAFDRGDVLAKYAKDAFEGKAKAKAEGKSAIAFIKKLLANAGYGWFGIRVEGKSGIKIFPKNDKQWVEYLFAGELVAWGDRGDYTLVRTKSELPVKDFHVGVAAAVTSWARMKLWKSMDTVLAAGGKVYYCDTDSIICDMDFSKHLSVARALAPDGFLPDGTWSAWCAGEELGSFKNELCDKLKKWLTKDQLASFKAAHPNPAFTRGVIALCKLYALQWDCPFTELKRTVTAAKGLSQASYYILHNDQLINPEDGRTVATRNCDGKFYTETNQVVLPHLLRNVQGQVVDRFGTVIEHKGCDVKMGRLEFEEYRDLVDFDRPIVRYNEQWTKPSVDMMRENHTWQLAKVLVRKEIYMKDKYCKGHVCESGDIVPLHFPQDMPIVAEAALTDDIELWDKSDVRVDDEELDDGSQIGTNHMLSFEDFRKLRVDVFEQALSRLPLTMAEAARQRFDRDVEFRCLALEMPEAALEDYELPFSEDELFTPSADDGLATPPFQGVTPPPLSPGSEEEEEEEDYDDDEEDDEEDASPQRKRFRSIFVDDEAQEGESDSE
jgi:hypothetical protein